MSVELQSKAQEAQIVDLIVENIVLIQDQTGLKIPPGLQPDTALFGAEGFLDSMGLVTLVVALEQSIEEKFGVSVTLADAAAMSQERSPYRTIRALAEYAILRMQAD
jgi:acyl carrier protein